MTAKVEFLESALDDWFDADNQPPALRRAIARNNWGQLWERIAEGKRRD